jgi:hypothetical protein
MRRIATVASVLSLCLVAATLRAEQEVTLKSGATLVGDVSFDGAELVVDIDDAKQRVPLSEVASVTPVEFGNDRQATRLLLSAFEARLLGGSPKEAVGLLAEASRLAPDDPRIAFWYASTLVDAGSGKAAKRILEERREQIEEAFPDAIDDLASRVNLRMMLELLPAPLVTRIDKLNAAAAVMQPAANQMQQVYSAFRVLDQYNDPVAQSAFQVQCNGQDERVEEFGDGYFMLTYSRHRNQDDDSYRLVVRESRFRPETHELKGTVDRVYLAGDVVLHRFMDEEKQPVTIIVVDNDGNPLPGARVALQAVNQNGGPPPDHQNVAVDEAGRATLQAFPGEYSASASADGYNTTGDQFEVAADGHGAIERRISLHKAIRANVRIEWISKSFQPGAAPGFGGTTSGEATLAVGQPGGMHPNHDLMWLRPAQVGDRVSLQFNLMMFGPMGFGGGGPWIKKLAVGEGDGALAAADKKFDEVDLKEIDDLPDEFKSVAGAGDNRMQGMIQSPADDGDVFVGRVMGRDMRTGQPAEVAFKAIVEQPEDEAAERP